MADGRELVLVRHGQPDVREDEPAETWELRDDARTDVLLLAEALPKARVIASSDEPKAERTATIIREVVGGELHVDVRLREVTRPVAWVADYEERGARYLTRGHEPGWEPADRVRTRVIEAMSELPSGAIVVGHGLSLTLFTATHGTFDHVSFWRGLRLPDAWVTADGVGPRLIDPPATNDRTPGPDRPLSP